MWQRLYTFLAGKKASANQMNQELDQIIGALNDIETADNRKDADLRKIAQLMKITNDNGGVKLNITDNKKDLLTELAALGVGPHTFYAVDGTKNLPAGKSVRGFFHNTGSNIGWLICFDYSGSIYWNYYNSGSWMGWNTKPYAESNKTGQSNIQPNTWTKIQNPARVNRGGGTWSTTGDYTVPSSGVYECVLVAYLDGLTAGDGLYTALYTNGILGDQHRIDQRQAAGAQDGISIGSTIIDCAAGDVLNFWIWHSGSVAKPLKYAHMKIAKLN